MNEHIAHVDSEGKKQTLSNHLNNVASLSEKFASKIGLSECGRVLGLLHDIGKASTEFQNYLKSATGLIDSDNEEYIDSKLKKGKIDHSTAGAQYIFNELENIGVIGQGEIVAQILFICLVSHHGGMIDVFDKMGKFIFNERLLKDYKKTHYDEVLEKDKLEFLKLNKQILVKELFGMVLKVTNISEKPFIGFSKISSFNLGFLTRFLFSCLIDADRIDSAEFEDPYRKSLREENDKSVDWNNAIEKLESFLFDLPVRNEIDNIRRDISKQCIKRAEDDSGIFTLSVPTGGGKTYASLRFALHHAQKHKMDRIIYVIPYTSIIEQNASAIRKILETNGETWILEHHSNLEPEEQTWRNKIVSENWDAPIVFTTMVQLLDTFFSGGTKSARRLHQLANSVLIFDEIQTLPIKSTHLFCNALNFMTKYCKSTAVLCTATQPLLNKLKKSEFGQLELNESSEIIENVADLYENLERVTVHNKCTVNSQGWSEIEIVKFVLEQFQAKGSCLVIVNTKDWAKSVFKSCLDEVSKDSIYHLSTNQCCAHRKELLEKIKNRLKKNQPVLCVSTQLIEAGVDVDFATVIRFLAGLDSIAQAAGRCNRNGLLKNDEGNDIKGEVYVINPDKESTGMLTDIEVGKEKAKRVLGEDYKSVLSSEAMDQYFKYYFYERSEDMMYKISKKQIGYSTSILNLLSDNYGNCGKYTSTKTIPLLRQSFKEAGKQFKAIEAPTQGVIVQYEKGKDIVSELCSIDFRETEQVHRYYELLKQAQQYSVNVFPNIWKKLQKNGAIQEIQPGIGIFYLLDGFYSKKFGLTEEQEEEIPLAMA